MTDLFAPARIQAAALAMLSTFVLPCTAGQQAQFSISRDADAPGYDYKQLDGISFQACQSRCSDDVGCRAFTYNTPRRVCFLKSSGHIQLKRFAGAITGIKTVEGAPPNQQPVSSGTGFAVSANGLVVTSRHVVENCKVITVEGWGTGVLKAEDRLNDLALIKIDGEPSPVTFRSTPPSLGESVFATGYPYGGLLGAGLHFTSGLVSSLTGIENDSRFLQFTAPVQPGNSGGPLLDDNALVIGVVSGRLNDIAVLKASGSLPQNVNFAIHGGLVMSFLRANGVDPVAASSSSVLSPSEIAKKAKVHTFKLSCGEASPTAMATAPAQSDSPPTSSVPHERATNAASEFFRTWSLANQKALAFLDGIYPSQTDYYGKVSSKAAVMSVKQAFTDRWPVRNYSIQPETVATSCDAESCTVSGVVDWRTYSAARGVTSTGSAMFHLRFANSDQLVLLSESGEVLTRKVERGRR